MKKLLLLTLLYFSINGFAFNWKYVASNPKSGDDFYVDVDSIEKIATLFIIWCWVILWNQPSMMIFRQLTNIKLIVLKKNQHC